jgi:peroxiredoxin
MQMIYRTTFSFFTILFLSLPLNAQNGHHIEIEVEGIRDTFALWCFHYGEQKMIRDTVWIDSKGKGVIKADTLMSGGIYLYVLPAQQYFEVIVSDDQQFKLRTKDHDFANNMVVEGSLENEVFFNDIRYVIDQRVKYNQMGERLEKLKSNVPNHDSIAIYESAMRNMDSLVRDHRTKTKAKYPDLFYTKFLHALDEPEVKAPLELEDGTIDSTYPYRYFKAHFFDNIDFSDNRMLRTPILEQKLKTYLDRLTVQHPDSLIESCDYLIEKARADKEVFRFVLAWTLNKYAKREFMGMDAVYVHLAETYYATGQAYWATESQLKRIIDDAAKMKPLLLGKKAPNFTVKTRDGRSVSPYSINGPEYLILYFWDADCGHCRKETPKLYELYPTLKAKYNVEIMAITVELTEDHWAKFLDEQKMHNWINAQDFETLSNFRAQYDIKGTPVVFILDKNKEIIGKRLSVEQLEGFFEFEHNKKAKGQG